MKFLLSENQFESFLNYLHLFYENKKFWPESYRAKLDDRYNCWNKV